MDFDIFKEWEKHKENTGNNSSAESIFKNQDNHRCEKCMDKGFYIIKGKPIKCVDCEGLIKKENLLELTIEDTSKIINSLNIPNYYINREFTPEVLKKNENLDLDLRRDPLMDFYILNLRKIFDSFVLGKKLDNSYLIMAPQGYSKAHLVYCSMQEAIKHGFSVAPYCSTEDIHKIKLGYDSNESLIHDLITKDVCFIYISPAFVTLRDTQAVKYILDKRSKRNLPTVVTSRFNMNYLKEIEPHLGNNFGLKNVDKGDYSKLKEVLGPYPKDYSRNNKWNNK